MSAIEYEAATAAQVRAILAAGEDPNDAGWLAPPTDPHPSPVRIEPAIRPRGLPIAERVERLSPRRPQPAAPSQAADGFAHLLALAAPECGAWVHTGDLAASLRGLLSGVRAALERGERVPLPGIGILERTADGLRVVPEASHG